MTSGSEDCGVFSTSFKFNHLVDPAHTKYPVTRIYEYLPSKPKLNNPYHMFKVIHDKQNHQGWGENTTYRKKWKKKPKVI